MIQTKIFGEKVLQAHIKIKVPFASEFKEMDYPLSSPYLNLRILFFFMQMTLFTLEVQHPVFFI